MASTPPSGGSAVTMGEVQGTPGNPPSRGSAVTMREVQGTPENPCLQITPFKLNGNNFLPWSQSATLFLSGKFKLGYVNGKIQEPPIDETKYDEWKSNNDLVMSWLFNSMESHVRDGLLFLKTAHEVWKTLSDIYSEKNNIARAYQLKQEIAHFRKGDKTFNEYLGTLRGMWQELSYYVPISTDPQVIRKRIEQDQIFEMLAGLDSDYEAIRSQILMQSELPSLNDVCALLQREEKRRAVMKPTEQSNMEHSAFFSNTATNRGRGDRGRGRGRGRGFGDRPRCSHCNKLGHVKERCWELYGRPMELPEANVANASKESNVPTSLEKLAELLDAYTKQKSSSAHVSLHSEIGKTASAHLVESSPATWIVDTGATDHMTGTSKIFLLCNQLSNLTTRKTIGEGREKDGLYLLDQSAYALISHNEDNHEDTWHSRLETSNNHSAAPNFEDHDSSRLSLPHIDNQSINTDQASQSSPKSPPHQPASLELGSDGNSNSGSQSPLVLEHDSLPIALRKGKRNAPKVTYPIENYISYHTYSNKFKSFVASIDGNNEPTSYAEAITQPEWRKAMKEELNALEKNHTWDLALLPKGKKPVGCRWVYKIKYHPDGRIERYKARLVAKGFTQIYGVDYKETFAPVAKMSSVRVLLSVAINLDWPLYQLDVKNAFLYGELQEEVYMSIPPGHPREGERDLVCRLRKSIYGLKQSPRAWFEKLSSTITSIGFVRNSADYSMFVKKEGTSTTIILVYVDDIILTGDNQKVIEDVKKWLKIMFDIKDLGELRYFLGIEVARSKKGIFLSQRKYTLDLLKETGKLASKPLGTPVDIHPDLKKGELIDNVGLYQRLVGRLIYLTITRPDISYAVSLVSKFMHSPQTSHMNSVNRILRYLKSDPGKGILMRKNGNLNIVGYSDADWAGCPIDRHSTTGYCTLLGGNLVTWKSKKQNVVSRSSAEAEYRAMASTACELVWLKALLKDMGFNHDGPIQMKCDNQAAIHISTNPVFHERTKHIEVDCHFVREKV
uniref:Reverse transcriptase Ty1/copia-type domain-containing protein n=1 Tax=Ananas comosus var. bracteatus TaxID=296719 RepID=A0A6V7P690_ANACO|nr:unnamed protein product [Ananas comosus var. bracteatus]